MKVNKTRSGNNYMKVVLFIYCNIDTKYSFYI